MKKAPLLLLFNILLISFTTQAQEFEIRSSDSKHLSIHFTLSEFHIDTLRIDGKLMHTISSKGITAPNDYGLPDLVTFSRFVALPQGAEAVVRVNSKESRTIKDIDIVPSIGSQCENEPERSFYRDPKVYNVDAYYPASEVATSAPLNLRGVDVLHFGVCPVQYNPVRRELIVHDEIDIEIDFIGGNGHFGDDRLRSPYWDPILKNSLLNYSNLEPIDYEKRMQEWTRDGATGCEYIILTPSNEAFSTAAQELADYRRRQGILTQVFTIAQTGATSPGLIRQWFRTAYSTWDIPPVAVCIIGEHGENLEQYVPGFQTQHPLDGFCVSDNPYADVNDDNLPDICFSRLVAENESELPIFIGKQLEYEYTNPNMNDYTYSHPVTACGWHTTKWFQLTIETIGGYLKKHNKIPIRINNIYNGEPSNIWSSANGTSTLVSYFGPEGTDYIPATPDVLGGWDTGTKEEVIQAFNNGAFLVQHRDHGWTQKWYQPEIYVSDFSRINNPGKMPFLISVNCRTGEFDAPATCFTEGLIRMTRDGENAGIVGAISPSAQSYSFANDIYLWGVWDLFDPTFLPDYGPYADHVAEWLPSFANVSGKYFLEQAVFPNTNQEMRVTTYNIYHTHADAFLRVYTDIPQTMEISHDPTITSFTPFHITAPQGTQIAITCTRNGEIHILDVTEATGEDQKIYIMENVTPEEHIHLTITGLNYLRHEEDLELIPIEGPCVVTESFSLSEDTLHHEQDLTMGITLKNYGQEASQAGTATLISESEYLIITSPTVQIPAMETTDIVELPEAFQFHISSAATDDATMTFVVRTEHDDLAFEHSFNISTIAPNVVGSLIGIEDYDGNQNSLLDPGEHAHLTFQIVNNGHYDAERTTITLISDGYLNVITPSNMAENLHIGDTTEVIFDVYAEWISGEVRFAELTLIANADGTESTSSISCPIGLTTEDFEDGINPILWNNDADYPWTITHSQNFEGNSCAQSGTITHNQTSTLSITHTSNVNGSISFSSRVSSETNYDWLKFYIDDNEKGSWSGDVYWAQHTYSVHPGTHTYTWSYVKDYSVSNDSDCAWLDYIIFPAYLDDVEETANHTLTVHPNPTTDMIHITVDDSRDLIVNVFDEQGKLVISEQNTTDISFKRLAPGMYHIKAIHGDNCWTTTIVKM